MFLLYQYNFNYNVTQYLKHNNNIKDVNKLQNSRHIALVIGASSGIGLEVAKKLADSGMTVYGAQRTPCPYDKVNSIQMDVTEDGSIASGINGIISEKGGIDILVYCAGTSMAAPVEYATDEDMRHLFNVNYFGAVKAVQSVVGQMRSQRNGRIVLVSSVGSTLPIAFDAFYSGSKAALNMLCKELEIELSPYNIFVTSVCPGGTATRFTFKRKVYPDQDVGVYADAQNKAVISLANIEQGGMSAETVAESIVRVLESAHPKSIVAAGATNKSYMFLDKVLPTRVSQFLNKNQYKQ